MTAGLLDLSDWEPENVGKTPQALFEDLIAHRPQTEELVFTHGDYCLPNVFIEGDEVRGFIDLGRAGIADRWQDIALCLRSILHNFGTKEYDRLFFDCLNMEPDWAKIEYFVNLDEFF